MKKLQQTSVVLLAAAGLAACGGNGAGGGMLPGASAPRPAPLKEVPPAEVFATAVRDICFGAILEDRPHADLAGSLGFTQTEMVAEKFVQSREDQVYRAEYTSVPVLVGIGDEGTRCSVTAVRGDTAGFKQVTEEEIASFSARWGNSAADYIAFAETHPLREYALRFTLLTGSNLTERQGAIEEAKGN